MIGMNIRILRKKLKVSQEELAERVDVSRQTIAKWENGESLPDIHKCRRLADIFEVTLDQLSSEMKEEEVRKLNPRGKHFFGVVKVGERGQIVIPKEARDIFRIQAKDKLVVLGDESAGGIAVLKSDHFLDFADMIRKAEYQEEQE